MKLHDPRISILMDESGARIEITDSPSGITFLCARVTPENFTAAMGRLLNVDCTADVYSLDRIGFQHEHKPFVFKLPNEGPVAWDQRAAVAHAAAKEACPAGWEPTSYFGSQDSFFTKDGEDWARCKIERWAPVEEQDDQ